MAQSATVLIPDLMGLFWILNRLNWTPMPKCLNPRFDGAFLNWLMRWSSFGSKGLNPRFDGAFLNYKVNMVTTEKYSLNPRFDGAFLNSMAAASAISPMVLIPDLMGLFWITNWCAYWTVCDSLNPRFDGAFLNFQDTIEHRIVQTS